MLVRIRTETTGSAGSSLLNEGMLQWHFFRISAVERFPLSLMSCWLNKGTITCSDNKHWLRLTGTTKVSFPWMRKIKYILYIFYYASFKRILCPSTTEYSTSTRYLYSGGSCSSEESENMRTGRTLSSMKHTHSHFTTIKYSPGQSTEEVSLDISQARNTLILHTIYHIISHIDWQKHSTWNLVSFNLPCHLYFFQKKQNEIIFDLSPLPCDHRNHASINGGGRCHAVVQKSVWPQKNSYMPYIITGRFLHLRVCSCSLRKEQLYIQQQMLCESGRIHGLCCIKVTTTVIVRV